MYRWYFFTIIDKEEEPRYVQDVVEIGKIVLIDK